MKRLAAATLALLAGGCLAPQDIAEAESDEAPKNHAPRIVVDQALVEGMPTFWLHVQSSCESLRFKVGAIEDLDVGDGLELRFFVDYDRGCDGCTDFEGHELKAAEDTRPIRTTDFEFELRSLDVGTHFVEAWVSDGFSEDATATPVNRAVREGRGVDAVGWVIEVHEAENLPCQPDPA